MASRSVRRLAATLALAGSLSLLTACGTGTTADPGVPQDGGSRPADRPNSGLAGAGQHLPSPPPDDGGAELSSEEQPRGQ